MEKATNVTMVCISWQLEQVVSWRRLIGHHAAGIMSQSFCSKYALTEQYYNVETVQTIDWILTSLHEVQLS